jgi:N6-L-threonylcarbamoyladenine synthase
MGLGFPGGVQVDKLSAGGNPKAFPFPRGLLHEDNLKFSFSGLKSAAARQLDAMTSQEREDRKNDLCASYQAAIVEVLVAKMKKAAKQTGYKNWTVTGGVSANSGLRAAMTEAAAQMKATLALPPLRYCTDNAAMTGLAGMLRLRAGEKSGQDLSPVSSSLESDWTA